jgi:glycosyltransferase involved in cell wall biosynthesis
MVTGAYYPEISSSGIQCQTVARAVRDSVAIEVLTTSTDRALPAREVVDGVRVRRVFVDVRSPLSRLRASIVLVVRLFRSMPRVDIVHVHGFSTKNVFVAAAARLFGKPVVLSLHTAGHDEPRTVAGHGRLARWAYESADLFLSVSPGLVDAYLAAGMPVDRIRLVTNGIDLDRFAPASPVERCESRGRLGLPKAGPIILYVGFFSNEKQPQVLFDAWLDLQRDPATAATLVFVGATRSMYYEVDATIEARMRDRAAAAGLPDRLVFAGPTHRVDEYYRAADFFALPSRREGLPVALLEAMSAGLPAVASHLPGATDVIVDDGVNGVLVPPGDVAAFRGALDMLMRNPARAAELGANARRTIESRFASGRVADAWLDAYASLLKTRA